MPSKNLAQRAANYYTYVQYFYAGFLPPKSGLFWALSTDRRLMQRQRSIRWKQSRAAFPA
jgi:hypothetical protein